MFDKELEEVAMPIVNLMTKLRTWDDIKIASCVIEHITHEFKFRQIELEAEEKRKNS